MALIIRSVKTCALGPSARSPPTSIPPSPFSSSLISLMVSVDGWARSPVLAAFAESGCCAAVSHGALIETLRHGPMYI